MTDPTDSPSPYTDQEIDMLAALRDLQPDDGRLVAPPPEVWASIDAAVSALPESRPADPAAATTGRRWWLGAAAALVVVGAGVAAAGLWRDDADVVLATTVLTSDGLEGAPPGLRGQADVVESSAGEVIRVDVGGARPATGEFLEVWLIKADVSGMVSLGTVRPDGTYEFPQGLSLADYPIVDVSTEPYDGDPKHSGASLLRGQIDL